ncbi:hypothetical protein ACKUB1_12365 [Methanospirillum stamsii]|nr:hypothetical protein [Methanospirillum stamsii]
MGRKNILLTLCVLIFLFTTQSMASMTTMPDVQLPLGPPASYPPFDDEEFFRMANSTISLFCNGETLPVGRMNTAFHDKLASSYYSLIRMNVSEGNYTQAEDITTFLSYTLTLVEQYEDYETERTKYSPVDMGLITDDDLEEWYDAASDAWKKLAPFYPDAKMYGMPPVIERVNWIPSQFPIT